MDADSVDSPDRCRTDELVASGAISANGHGNVSLRVPDSDEMYFTARPVASKPRRIGRGAGRA